MRPSQLRRALVPLLSFGAFVLAAAPASSIAAPVSFIHSGMLIDGADRPVDGATPLTFRLWANPVPSAGETATWTAACTIQLSQGRFAAHLGAGACTGDGLDTADLPSGSARFLEISVGGVTLLPRLPIQGVPLADVAREAVHAQSADDATSLGGLPAAAYTQSAALSAAGTVNAATNPVDWTQLKNVPVAFADGSDDGATYSAAAGGGLELNGQAFGIAAGAITGARLAAGSVTDDKIASVSASKLTGTLSDAQIASVSASKLTGTVTDAQIASLSASKITGTLADGQIASLSASKLTGTVANGQIASLSASKITGTLSASQLPPLQFNQVTGGTLSLPTSATAPTGVPAGTVYWDTAENALRVFNGTTWNSVGQNRCGKTSGSAGVSCRTILEQCSGSTSGLFWLDPDGDTGSTAPFQAYCDMTKHGGGWALVGKLGESFMFSASDLMRQDVSTTSLLDTSNPPSTAFYRWNLQRFDGWGRTWTLRAEVDSNNTGAHYQYTFWRPKDGTTISLGTAGGNWMTEGLGSQFVYLHKSTTTGASNTTWNSWPGWDLPSASIMMWSYRRGDLNNDCLNGSGQTQVCHCPAGSLNNYINGGTHTACFQIGGDGISHSHNRRAFYWVRDTNVGGSP